MALKINTTSNRGIKKNNSKLKINTTSTKLQNDGSLAGYLGQKAAIGLAGIGEGIYDFTVGGIYQLIGDKDYAKYLHDNDVVGEWNERLDKTYNPTGTVKVLGDIATGVGQALPSVAVGIATGGTSAAAQLVGSTMLGMGYAGRGITDAVKQTGELGLKENIYGMATGALEGVTDAVLGGTQKAGKALWTTMRQGAKAGAGKIARNTLVKGILSSAASEATEEFLQEFADTALLRLTKVNREAEFSLSNALYSGFIGGITGGLLGGATGAVNATANLKRGLDVMARGNADTLIKTANYVRQNHVGNSKNYGNVTSEALRALTASVDAYNALADKNGNSAAVILGEIKVELAAFENAAGIDAIKAQMMERAPIELAAEASRRRGKTYTAEDIRKNTDGITEELALDSFVTGAFAESAIDTKKAAIDEAIAEERMPYISQSAAWDGQSAASYRDPASGRYVFVEPSSEDGKWRLGFSATAIYDENDLRIKDGLDTESIKKALAGVADGSLVMTERGIVARGETEANGMASVDTNGTGRRYSLSPTKIANLEKFIDDLGRLRIRKQIPDKTITILTDEFTKNKAIYSQKGRNSKEVNARIKAIPYFAQIIKSSKYSFTDTEINGLGGKAKNGVVAMHHFTAHYEGYDVDIVVRDKGKRQFLYEVKFIQNKKSSQQSTGAKAPPTAPNGDVENKLIITQNPKKSTPKAKKVERKFLADETEADGEVSKDAQKGAETAEGVEGAQVEDSEAKRAAEDEMKADGTAQVTEREQARGYSDEEADKARSVIKDFDLMSREKRLAIVDMMRSAKDAGASLSFMKHAAAMIGYWRKGLYIVCDGKTTEKGFWREFKDGSRLIVVNPAKADKGKNGINTVFLHELAHDIWSRASDATRKELYEMALEGTDKKEAADIRKKYENGYKQRGLKLEDGVIEEEIFTNLLSKTLNADDFLSRLDITPKRTSGLKRVVKSVVRMAKCFFGKDKYLYRRCESMAVALAKVMGAQILELTSINQEKAQVSGARYSQDDEPIDSTKRTFSYAELTAKPDMQVTVIDKKQRVKLLPNGSIDVKDIDKRIKQKCQSIQTNAKEPTYYVKVPDIGRNVMISNSGIAHGLIKSSTVSSKGQTKKVGNNAIVTAKVSLMLPEILKNSIEVNIAQNRGNLDVPYSHILLGEAAVEDLNSNIEYYVMRFVVEERVNQNPLLVEANILGKLYAANAKKIGTPKFGALPKSTVARAYPHPIEHSISDFLNFVKGLKVSNEVFSADVAKNLGVTRSVGRLTPSLRYSFDEDIDTDTFFANALENGGVITHEEAEAMRGEKTKSQTAEKKPKKKSKTKKQLAAELKEVKRDNRGLKKSNAKLGESVSRTQSANADLREKNRKLTARERGRKSEAEKFEKQLSHEQERMQRQTSEGLKREGVEIMRITRNIDFFKNSVLHRKGTDGAVEGAKILSDPGILAFARVISSKADAYHILHETSRQAARVLLPCYKPENPLFGGNAIGELCKLEGENNLFSGYRPEIATAIETLANGKGQLSAYEIKLLDQVVGHIAHLYKTYDTVKVEGKRQSAITYAYGGYHDAIFARKATVKGDGKLGLKRLFKFLREGYLYTVITPEEVLRDVERHVKGGVLSTLFREVRLGEAEAGRIRATVLWDISEFLAKHKKFHKELDAERFEFGRGSDKIMISTAQAVGLYETSKREHARQRLFSEDEGIRIATADGEVKVMKVTEKMINELYKQFNEVDLEYIKLLEAAMDACKKYKIDTDMEVMGFTNAIDGHYYPITTDENYFAKDITDIRQSFGLEQTVKNKSFNQNTVAGAQAWLFIESAQKVLERHVFGVSQYAGLFIPLQNFGKVYGVKFDPYTKDGHTIDEDGNERVSVNGKTSLREYLNNTVWTDKGLDNYLTKLFADIQGISAEKSNVVDRFISFIRSGYVNSVFGLNPKIIATQLAAFPAAYRLIDADCLAGAFSLKPISEENRKAMDKYSRITLSRRFEGANAAEGLIDKLSDFGKKTSIGIEMTDRGTILALYSACQLQVAKNGGAEVGSEANLKAAADLLDNVLLDTQTTALQSDRSVLMRSKSEFAKILTMFKTEAMKSFSQMYSAISSYHDHKKMAELDSSYGELLENDKKRIGRNAGAYMVSAAWVAGLSIAFSKLYKIGKEDDEELGEAIVKECIGSAFDMLPIVSDIAAFMIDGYDVDSLPLSVINDSLNMLRDIGTVFDVEKSRGDKLKYVRQSAYTVGKLVGLPVQNTYKLARTATAIANRSAVYRLDNFFNGSPSYKSDLDRAIEGKNTRLAQTVISLYMSDKLSSSVSGEVAKELVRVYSAGGSLPRAIPSSLDAKQRADFAKVYSGADTAIAELIVSKEYKALDDAEKAKAIKDCYAEYYKMAKSAIGADN